METKSFTQEEIDEIVKSRLARAKTGEQKYREKIEDLEAQIARLRRRNGENAALVRTLRRALDDQMSEN